MFPLAMPSCSAEGIPDEELDSDDLGSLLQSLRFFKAKYNHMTHQEEFFYDALRFVLSFLCWNFWFWSHWYLLTESYVYSCIIHHEPDEEEDDDVYDDDDV